MTAKLLVGTNNIHKAGEIAALLKDLSVRVVSPRDLGIAEEPAEEGSTFAENALEKARFYSRRAGLPCLADDSGLVVDALDGRPGVRSSRYAPSDKERIAKLLDELEGVADTKRTARFVCAAALVDAERQTEVVEEGRCEGRISRTPIGDGGFGYDPVFYLPDEGLTMAQLSAEEKNARSHRGRALEAIYPHIEKLFRSV